MAPMENWYVIPLFLLVLVIISPLLGQWLVEPLSGRPGKLLRILSPVEYAIYRITGIDPEREMHWKSYLTSLLLFNTLGLLVLFILQIMQSHLPFNPRHLPNVPSALAFNTAVSFATNTNWQSYSGENTLSNFLQMAGLGVQNFLSAATGIAVFLALTRGLIRRSSETLGNFWADLTRSTVYVLLPLSLILAVILIQQGVVQTLVPDTVVTTLEGKSQVIPLGPAASQIAIKQLGTNGGGFFGVNSAHPFENPTPLTNWLELLAILLLPAALPFTFGKMVGNQRHGWVLFFTMLLFLAAGSLLSLWAEGHLSPLLSMEGKEVRFGVVQSVLWGAATTVASNGSVNAMHASMAPLTGLVQLFNMMTGEVIFGGVGSGMYGMVLYIILTVFVAGLMVGRSPEYLGKRIDSKVILWTIIGLILPSALILLGTAVTNLVPGGMAALKNSGPRGFTEILYAWTSAAANNGSAYAGLNAGANFYCIGLGIAMLLGRFGVIVPVMVIAGYLSSKNPVPPSAGTFPTDTPTFAGLLFAIIVIMGALTFLPALALGPVVEHLLWLTGRLF
ncbi:MAG: potassium-transporting ATPase subunit KdpA [Fibrobacterota bacterium]